MDFHNLHCVSWRTAVHRLASALWLLRESYRGAPHLAGLCGQYNEDGFGLPVGGQLRDTALGGEAGAGQMHLNWGGIVVRATRPGGVCTMPLGLPKGFATH